MLDLDSDRSTTARPYKALCLPGGSREGLDDLRRKHLASLGILFRHSTHGCNDVCVSALVTITFPSRNSAIWTREDWTTRKDRRATFFGRLCAIEISLMTTSVGRLANLADTRRFLRIGERNFFVKDPLAPFS